MPKTCSTYEAKARLSERIQRIDSHDKKHCIDVLYARLVPEAAGAFPEAADFLLLVQAVTVLAAVGAIGLGWQSSGARNLLVASAGVIPLGFLTYALLSPVLPDGSPLGAGIRILLAGAASVLAFAGFAKMRTRV